MDEGKLDAVIPRPRACREHLGVSLSTAWRRERNDPNWPRPVCMGGNRFGYMASSISSYLAGLPEKSRPGA